LPCSPFVLDIFYFRHLDVFKGKAVGRKGRLVELIGAVLRREQPMSFGLPSRCAYFGFILRCSRVTSTARLSRYLAGFRNVSESSFDLTVLSGHACMSWNPTLKARPVVANSIVAASPARGMETNWRAPISPGLKPMSSFAAHPHRPSKTEASVQDQRLLDCPSGEPPGRWGRCA